MMTDFGDLPVVLRLTRCEHTKTGWRGVDADGIIHDVTYRPGENNGGLTARMPEKNFIIAVENGRRIGVWLLERKRKRSAGLRSRR